MRQAHSPLTPHDAVYPGLARIAGAEAAPVEAHHLLRWPSRSRPGKEHFSSCDERGGDVRCTCEAWTYRGACGHAAGHLDALAHHGVTFGPPADPDGAALDRAPNALDALVAAGGERWLVSRTPPRVTLTCASCAGTYRFDGEEQARRFVELALPCDQCGSVAGPTPPAPGVARRLLDECLQDLYGA